MLKKILLTLLLSLSIPALTVAQESLLDRAKAGGWEFELRAGLNLGGDVPIPFPKEIRSIESYSPQFNGVVEGMATKWLDPACPVGLSVGLRLEQKGMQTSARVKNYFTSIEHNRMQVKGVWSGLVETKSSSIALSVPLLANYRFSTSGKISGGLFLGYRFKGDFNGHVSDGYFRMGDPTGEKLSFSAEQRASYDFSDSINPLALGLQLGGSWRAYKQFSIFADIKKSLSPLFKQHFDAISFKMYPLYLSAGFSYLF